MNNDSNLEKKIKLLEEENIKLKKAIENEKKIIKKKLIKSKTM